MDKTKKTEALKGITRVAGKSMTAGKEYPQAIFVWNFYPQAGEWTDRQTGRLTGRRTAGGKNWPTNRDIQKNKRQAIWEFSAEGEIEWGMEWREMRDCDINRRMWKEKCLCYDFFSTSLLLCFLLFLFLSASYPLASSSSFLVLTIKIILIEKYNGKVKIFVVPFFYCNSLFPPLPRSPLFSLCNRIKLCFINVSK